MVAKKGPICPWHGNPCNEEACLAWTPFPAVNPKTGQVATDKEGRPQIVGEGCSLLGKVLKPAKA